MLGNHIVHLDRLGRSLRLSSQEIFLPVPRMETKVTQMIGLATQQGMFDRSLVF